MCKEKKEVTYNQFVGEVLEVVRVYDASTGIPQNSIDAMFMIKLIVNKYKDYEAMLS